MEKHTTEKTFTEFTHEILDGVFKIMYDGEKQGDNMKGYISHLVNKDYFMLIICKDGERRSRLLLSLLKYTLKHKDKNLNEELRTTIQEIVDVMRPQLEEKCLKTHINL